MDMGQANMMDNFGNEMAGMMGMDPMMDMMDPMRMGQDPMMDMMDPMMMGMDPMMMGPDPIELFEEEIDNIVINPDPYETNPQYFAFPNQGAYEQYMIYGPKNIIGSMFGETLYGAPLGNVYLEGMGGPDNIYPDDFGNYIGVGSDIVYGGQGSDTIYAGGGDDYIYGDEGTGDSFSIYGLSLIHI